MGSKVRLRAHGWTEQDAGAVIGAPWPDTEWRMICGTRCGPRPRKTARHSACFATDMLRTSRKKTAFVPRLAYGCVGVGMGVIPFCAPLGCGDAEPPTVGIRPAFV